LAGEHSDSAFAELGKRELGRRMHQQLDELPYSFENMARTGPCCVGTSPSDKGAKAQRPGALVTFGRVS